MWFAVPTLHQLNHEAKNSLIAHCGIEFIEIGDDYLSATLPVDARTTQPTGILHGGASCVLAETVGSAAGNCCVNPKTKLCVGLEINVNHIKVVRAEIVIACARPLHLGRTTQIWDIQIRNEAGQLVAVSRLTLAVLDK